MKPTTLRRWHRRAAIGIAPLLLLQTLSGLYLSYGRSLRTGELGIAAAPPAGWVLLLAKVHYGAGLAGFVYRNLLGLGLLWVLASGTSLAIQTWRHRNHNQA